MGETYLLIERTYSNERVGRSRREFTLEKKGNTDPLCPPQPTLKDLATRLREEGITIYRCDMITTTETSRFNPDLGCAIGPVDSEEILRFYKHYKAGKVSKAPSRVSKAPYRIQRAGRISRPDNVRISRP